MCPRIKSLVCSVPWTTRPLDDASLGRRVPLDDTSLGHHVPDRCVHRVLVVTSQFSEIYAWLCFYSPIPSLSKHTVKSVCPKGSGTGQKTLRPRDESSKGRNIEKFRSGKHRTGSKKHCIFFVYDFCVLCKLVQEGKLGWRRDEKMFTGKI
jgi:hypothetical protein